MDNQRNKEMSAFEKEVLSFIKKANTGSKKLGVGAFSLTSNQAGNEEISEALIDLKKAAASDALDSLNGIGKKLLKQVEDMAEEAITASSSDQARQLKQLQVLKKLLPLVSDQTDNQKKSKRALVEFIDRSEKGMKRNASFFNRFVDFAKSSLPSAAGIASGIAARSPMLGAVVNYALEKYQERQERIMSAEARNVNNLIETFEEIAEEHQKEINDAIRSQAPIEEAVEKVAEIQEVATGDTLEKLDAILAIEKGIFFTLERLREGAMGADDMSPLLEELHIGFKESIIEGMAELGLGIQEGMAEALAESGLVEMVPSEEERIEDNARMEEQTEVLHEISDNVRLNNKIIEEQAKGESGGIFGKLKGSLLGMFGIGAAGGIAPALLGKLKDMLKGLARFIPGLAALKGFGMKLLSFPAQFIFALINGAKRGIMAALRGEGFGRSVLEGIRGFANWLLFGMLDKITEIVSNSRILDPIFEKAEQAVSFVGGFFSGIWESAKEMFNGLRDLVSDPVDSVMAMKDAVVSWFQSAATTVLDVIEDPGAFFREKYKSLKDSLVRLFVSLIPDWIPTDILPDSIRPMVEKMRYGSGPEAAANRANNPVLGDRIGNTAANVRMGASDAIERVFGDPVEMQMEYGPKPGTVVRAAPGVAGSSVIDDILRREGGFVNDPNDRGGATKFGITQGTLSSHLGRQATVEDVRNLDESTAREIYQKNYVSPFEGVQDEKVRNFLIDSGVNHGVGRAKEWMSEIEGMNSQEAMASLIERRRKFYMGIVQRDPSQSKFLRGWMNRLSEFEEPAAVAQNDTRAAAIQEADSKIRADRERGKNQPAPVVASTVNQNNTSNSIMQKSAPVNPDPTFQRYAGAMV